MRAIFVSYRRDDSEGEAGRLFDDLVSRFGDASVFMDVAAIEVGRDFRKAIDESVATCGVLLAIIGKTWIDAKNEAGGRRLDDPSDFVRLETASALKRDIPVIPVLVHGATMPRADQLPDDLKDLAYRNGCELTHARWASDLQLLIKALGRYVDDPQKAAEAAGKGIGGGAAVQPAPVPVRDVRETVRPTPTASPWWKSRGAITAVAVGVVAAIALAVYLGTERSGRQPIPVAPGGGPVSSATSPTSFPGRPLADFSGQWELFSTEIDGVAKKVNSKEKAERLSITQHGDLVTIGKRELTITVTGTVTYQMFEQQDGRHVDTEQQADKVETVTWKVAGATLVCEKNSDYKVQFPHHPSGKETSIEKYSRVAP